ncbi:MAG: methyltransferase domain-containing protein [Chlamydiia bacterium]|nr:methyltransferase domain-containing protein [Chlamydiia bacterium]
MSSKGYPIGYSSSVVQAFQKRSAQEKAGFLLPHLKGYESLLDCGCGPGSITLDFASLLPQGSVCGVDIEPSQVEFSQKLMEERKIHNASFQTADILNLPFEDNSFDVAFVHAVLWTLEDALSAIRELMRVVKPGGLIASREPCMESVIYFPESKPFEKAFSLQFRAQGAMGCDRFVGRKLSFCFSQLGLQEIKFSISSDVFATPERRRYLADYAIAAWREAPWSQYIRKHSWASEAEIQSFEQALREWQEAEGAFMAASWCEALGRVP